jgi:RNase H-like domain found in reverse transcriptase
MNPHEQNYHAQEQELLAIVESLRHWRSYLHGQTFLVQTDHTSLQYLTTQDHLTPLQVRWLERLIAFDLKIVHISGKISLIADALSRSPKDIPSRDNTNQAIILDYLRQPTPHTRHHTKIHLISSCSSTLRTSRTSKLNIWLTPNFKNTLATPDRGSVLPP